MLQLLYSSLMTNSTICFSKFFKNLKETYYYLLPYPAACLPVTSSRRWGTAGHLAWPSTECSWY